MDDYQTNFRQDQAVDGVPVPPQGLAGYSQGHIEETQPVNLPLQVTNEAQPPAIFSSGVVKRIILELTSGKQFVSSLLGRTILFQREDGLIYFGSDSKTLFDVLEVSWDGPVYQRKIVTEEASQEKTKKGRRGRIGGAVIGSLLLPGAGTLIGAAVGTGGKAKTTGSRRQESYEVQEEVPAQCRITLENLATGKVGTITCNVTTEKGYALLDLLDSDPGVYEAATSDSAEWVSEVPSYTVEPTSPATAANNDPYAEVKKLKELLDVGIITQEEFDKKKAELLGL